MRRVRRPASASRVSASYSKTWPTQAVWKPACSSSAKRSSHASRSEAPWVETKMPMRMGVLPRERRGAASTRRLALLPQPAAQLELLDLAGGRARELLNDAQPLGPLRARQPAALEVCAHGGKARLGRARREPDHGTGAL